MKCDFTYRHYKEVIRSAKNKGYQFYTLGEYTTKKNMKSPVIVMRHDIDFSIEKAYVIAKIEKKLNINSTYFVRLHSKTYNAFEFKNYLLLKEMIEMGHEIGLHYEVLDFALVTKEDPINVLKKEKIVLERMLGLKVEGIAPHRDFTGINNGDIKKILKNEDFKKLGVNYEAYNDKFIKDMKYISDSRGNWIERCMCKFIEDGTTKLCILTHPMYWYEKVSVLWYEPAYWVEKWN